MPASRDERQQAPVASSASSGSSASVAGCGGEAARAAGAEGDLARAALRRIQDHFAERLTERTREIRQRYLQERRVREINAITAKALITSAFADAGMNASVSGQRYRACVTATLAGGRRLRLYVRYRDLSDPGLMERVLRAVADLEDALGRLGPGACVKA